LLQDPRECADLEFPVVRYDATNRAATEHDMASSLARNDEAKAFLRTTRFGAGNGGTAKCSLPLGTS